MSLRPTNDEPRPTRETPLLSHPAEGALRQADGQRVALVPLAFLADLRAALGQDFGSSTHHLLYCTGFDWSLHDMVRLGQRLRDEARDGDRDLWQMDATVVLEAWWAPLAAAGWGACTFTVLPQGLVQADIQGCAPARAAGRSAEPTCHLYAGLIAGALSFHERAERHAVEVQCAALGHPSCQFIAGASPQIDAVEKWQQQKLPAEEIRRRLSAPPDAAP